MVISGDVRLVTGLVVFSAVIALCLWLLRRLFPQVPDVPPKLGNAVTKEGKRYDASGLDSTRSPQKSEASSNERIR